jgi:hypothetical protein
MFYTAFATGGSRDGDKQGTAPYFKTGHPRTVRTVLILSYSRADLQVAVEQCGAVTQQDG